jgi:hypothetical protein
MPAQLVNQGSPIVTTSNLKRFLHHTTTARRESQLKSSLLQPSEDHTKPRTIATVHLLCNYIAQLGTLGQEAGGRQVVWMRKFLAQSGGARDAACQ